MPEPNTGCHLWTGAARAAKPGGDRYGTFWCSARRKAVNAHTWAWEQAHGPVPPGMVLDHRVCDTTLCVNVAHLAVATQRENILRGNSSAAVHARKTHCKRGHEFLPGSYHLDTNGARQCYACIKLRRRALADRAVHDP